MLSKNNRPPLHEAPSVPPHSRRLAIPHFLILILVLILIPILILILIRSNGTHGIYPKPLRLRYGYRPLAGLGRRGSILCIFRDITRQTKRSHCSSGYHEAFSSFSSS